MFGCRLSLFCVVAIQFICFFVQSSHTNKCKETEGQLLRFKGGATNGSKALSSWKGHDCCKWKGISCDNLTGHVTRLDLSGLYLADQLQGKLDSSICELKHLTSLDLSFNSLAGKIPKCIGNLSNLQTLNLGGNYLVADDLEWVSHLSSLSFLGMSSVNLSQAVDWLSSISKIPSLSTLSLSECQLPPINPESTLHLNSSTSLEVLDLSENNLNSLTLSSVLNVSRFLTDLDLPYNELEGSLPESFQSLCQLKYLDLRSSKLSGQLSNNMKLLRCSQNGLEKLFFDDNPLSSGPLPEFSGYSSLTLLSLPNTNIVGTLPHSLGLLPYLYYLDLSINKLSGPLSSFDVTELASLTHLDLSRNQLSGSLPHGIGQLSNLTSLSIYSNKLSGVISETHLSNLYSLTELLVFQNSLSFNLSSKWIPPFQLERFFASSCNLGPTFPTWLKHQMRLDELDISNSGISDSIPEWFWDIFQSLYSVDVSHNHLSGPLPQNLSRIVSRLDTFDFSFNNFSGPLPYFPPSNGIFLSNNRFNGSLSSFCASPPQELHYLDLSSNLLAGSLLDCWGKFKNLLFLNLAENKLTGRIPKYFGTLEQMESMHLNNNNFYGEIPSLTLCSSLILLDLGHNNLQGTLPAWVGHHLPQLIVLSLRENKFQGKIPKSLCDLSFLQVLDLSGNNIAGEIPQCLNHIIALSNITFPRGLISYGRYHQYLNIRVHIGSFGDKAILSWKGAKREYGKNVGLMTTIDLSCNHLTGEIPQSITKLVALASLNLSSNDLTGSIPNNIGQIERLESLDLSRNHLGGRMPTSFSNLSFLSYMNLSFNNLYGEIPIGTQLQSFNASSYIGNKGLCGPPLSSCSGDVMSPRVSSDEDKIITFGFYITLVLGFFVGFWGVCGTLVIKASWRNAYFQFFNDMNDRMHVTIIVFSRRMKRRFRVQA